MCTIETIRLSIIAVVAVRIIVGLYLMIVGGLFSTTDVIIQGYGVYFIEAGAGITMMGLTILLMSYPMSFAVKRHNRFVILSCFVIESIVFSQLISVGLNVYTPTIPIFDPKLMADCATNTPAIYSEEECNKYFDSDRTAGFRVVWSALFAKVTDEAIYQVMTNIEDSNLCCGFAPPMRCRNDTRQFPSQFPIDKLRTRMQKQRLQCGQYDGYYRQQKNCEDYFDENSIPKKLGGCEYDLGAGTCLDFNVVAKVSGCAPSVEQYVASQVSTNAMVVLGSSFVIFLCLVIDCCMYWKRKETDVFPDYVHAEVKKSKWSNYHRIRDNVVVIPTKDYLYQRGFLPDHRVVYVQEETKEGDVPSRPATSASARPNTAPKEADVLLV